jgi:parvulin-like peptidyl-prolyl isomerase
MSVLHAFGTFAPVIWIAGCAAPTTPTAPAPPDAAIETPTAGPPAARVNGQPITREAFVTAVEQHMARYRSGGHQLPLSIESRIRESILRRMVEDTLLGQKAEELRLAVTDDELHTAFEDHKARFRSPGAFVEYLTRSQQTEDQVRAALHRHLLRALVVTHLSGQVKVTEAEVHSYYADNRSRYTEREQIRASRILIRVAGEAQRERVREAQELAQKLHHEATREPQSFADLARQYSHGPQAKRGGDLGWFSRGRMHPDWDRVVFALEPGTTSQPLRTEHGFEVVAVWEHRAERERPFEEVAEEIRTALTARKSEEKRRAVLSNLVAQSQVDILIELGGSNTDASGSAPTGDDGV